MEIYRVYTICYRLHIINVSYTMDDCRMSKHTQQQQQSYSATTACAGVRQPEVHTLYTIYTYIGVFAYKQHHCSRVCLCMSVTVCLCLCLYWMETSIKIKHFRMISSKWMSMLLLRECTSLLVRASIAIVLHIVFQYEISSSSFSL